MSTPRRSRETDPTPPPSSTGGRKRARDVVALAPSPELAADIRRGLRAGEFRLLYQPEVALEDRRIVAFEALARWMRPDAGLVRPDRFIPAAAAVGALDQLEQWVLTTALAQSAAWTKHLPQLNVTTRVNASAQAVAADQVVPTLRAAIAEHDLDPGCLCVELTETAWDGDNRRLIRGVRRLKELGVLVALDDFGAGHNGLARLCAMPVDLIKIDRQFVIGIDHDERRRTIVAATLELGRQLNTAVTAEGVETEAEAQTLLDLGCLAAQGNLFGAAVDAAAMTALLEHELAGRTPPPA